jgi:hypothetical protein
VKTLEGNAGGVVIYRKGRKNWHIARREMRWRGQMKRDKEITLNLGKKKSR